ncbi:sialate O-acetylesterase [Botryobacter ruber]|uniref:sialate O-acetylesterase n=1 Tax=Botryobacter ruber TaxID=2171629 RepID=UPI000E0A94A0|nr:sialate O-acetylesterase [Botryobacter ruber]
MNSIVLSVRFLLVILFCASAALADVKLPRFISNSMVLQRDRPIPVWGWAEPGEKVSVSFNGKTYNAQTGTDKKWQVSVDATKAGGPFVMTVKGNNTIVIEDILIGDVWICSGQSNMQFTLDKVKEKYSAEIASSANPQIRHFKVEPAVRYEPAVDVKSGGWKQANPENVSGFTAVGYFFARELYSKYKVPIGLLHTSYGGTPAEAWVSASTLQDFPHYLQHTDEPAEGEQLTSMQERRKPTVLFNGMVSPLIPYGIKGVIWYQGEANAKKGREYRQLFPALIKEWREKWGQGDFPFLYVQLANFQKAPDMPAESDWAELREAQAMTLALPNTAMAVIHDIGEAKDIHPKNKKDVGLRLALAARKVAYGDSKVVYSGPTLKSVKAEQNRLVLSFDHIGGGLVAKGGGDLKQFAIAGPDKKYVWANARIEGDKVIVWHASVPDPVSVRYAWANNPEGANLYNKAGLPASSFRTDK